MRSLTQRPIDIFAFAEAIFKALLNLLSAGRVRQNRLSVCFVMPTIYYSDYFKSSAFSRRYFLTLSTKKVTILIIFQGRFSDEEWITAFAKLRLLSQSFYSTSSSWCAPELESASASC